jgi:hypothetical protein
MKKNDSGDFSVLYIEPNDEKVELFPVLAGQKKPVVLMLAEQSHAFQRPEDFSALKHIKRQYSLTIIFVFAHSNQLKQLATKNGFLVYASMDKLADAVSAGQMARQRALSRPTMSSNDEVVRRNTRPLSTEEQVEPLQPKERVVWQTEPLQHRDQTAWQEEPFEPEPAAPVARQAEPLRSKDQIAWPTEPFESRDHVIWPTEPFQPTEQIIEQPDMPVSGRLKPPVQAAQNGFSASDFRGPYSAPSRLTFQHDQREESNPIFQSHPSREAQEAQYRTAPIKPQFSNTPGRKRFSRVLIALTVALVLCIIGSFLVVSKPFQTVPTNAAAPPANIGQLTFTSSGQVNEDSSQGISDQVVLNMHDVPAPAANKKYYAWLLGDKSQSDPTSMLLGALNVDNGKILLKFAGDAKHSNLLLVTSRILITEEDASVPPITPSLDTSTWRYYGAFSSTPIVAADNPSHYSYLDHLRHLLAADPTLEQLELPGGLNNWFYNNTSKLVEWTSSMRETWMNTKDTAFMRRQTSRVLSYLDGSTYLYRDLPPNSPLLVDERLARVGLLDVNGPNQEPPDYVEHIDKHLRGLLEANDTSPSLRAQINDMITAINNINLWLTKIRQDAQKIVKMSDAQFRQPATLTLINDMTTNANNAFAGQVDPSTSQTLQGVSWLHDHMQLLATINITKVQPDSSGAIPQIIPGQMNIKAFVPYEVQR